MNPWSVLKLTLSIGVISELFYFGYRRRLLQRLFQSLKSGLSSTGKQPAAILPSYSYRVLFFPDKEYPCKLYAWRGGCNSSNCTYTHSETNFKVFGDHLYSARSSLDVCVYTISSSVLCDIILDVHRSGVPVRVILDDESDNFTGSIHRRLRENGVPLRTDKSSFLMHHKFVIIDREMIMNGSFNWTRNAITANNENVLITDNPAIVTPYIEEFEKLWGYFHPSSGITIERPGHHSDRR